MKTIQQLIKEWKKEEKNLVIKADQAPFLEDVMRNLLLARIVKRHRLQLQKIISVSGPPNKPKR